MSSPVLEREARPVGRLLRTLLGALLVWHTGTVLIAEDSRFNIRVLGILVGLTILYSVLHVLIGGRVERVNRWVGAVVAVLPVVLVFVLGGPVGRVGAVGFIGLSLALQGLRGDGGCEVMALPGLFTGKRTHLMCIVFSPLDWLERRLFARGP